VRRFSIGVFDGIVDRLQAGIITEIDASFHVLHLPILLLIGGKIQATIAPEQLANFHLYLAAFVIMAMPGAILLMFTICTTLFIVIT